MICACIRDKKDLRKISSFELAELRFDLLNLNDEEIEKYSSSRKIIVTCREGDYGRDARLEILKRAVKSGAGYVDIEIEADAAFKKELSALASRCGCTVIVSYHNFDYTPSSAELEKITADCAACGDIAKIVTTALNEKDAARVLALYSCEFAVPVSAFAMGDAGKITRVAGAMLGSPITYTAVSADKMTAGSQYTYDEMRSILGKL